MDSAEFHARVYEVVRMIPYGKATSYGHIARLIGMPRHARHVGQALKFLPPMAEAGDAGIPWHRVLSSTGHCSSRGPGTAGAQRQREALEAEGVTFRDTRDGEGGGKVDWSVHGWFPASVEIDREDADEERNQEEEEGDVE